MPTTPGVAYMLAIPSAEIFEGVKQAIQARYPNIDFARFPESLMEDPEVYDEWYIIPKEI